MMGRFGIPEDQPIESRFINRTLESAQAKIEGFHFDARKHTLEYDDVMNHQRKIIYERRQKMLFADKDGIEEILKSVKEEHEGFGKIIEEKKAKLGLEAFYETVRRIALYATDTLWMEHLESMDYLRSSVNLRAYGQREPIVEYKKDGLAMFKDMEEAFKEQVFSLVSNITEPAKEDSHEGHDHSQLITNQQDSNTAGAQTVNSDLTIGRNDPCPCGAINPSTGEVYKYKKCGLINAPQHRKSLIN
jgi:preprotein translocase subunit SecA